jgi:hypothetical protein
MSGSYRIFQQINASSFNASYVHMRGSNVKRSENKLFIYLWNVYICNNEHISAEYCKVNA